MKATTQWQLFACKSIINMASIVWKQLIGSYFKAMIDSYK
jgi:hypothetical protein